MAIEVMKFHHVGCLVRNLDSAVVTFSQLLGQTPTDLRYVARQQVTVCFLPLGTDGYLELVCPGPEARGLLQLLDNGNNYYHLAFIVADIESQVEALLTQGFELVTTFHSEAFQGALCAFLRTPTNELVELIDLP